MTTENKIGVVADPSMVEITSNIIKALGCDIPEGIDITDPNSLVRLIEVLQAKQYRNNPLVIDGWKLSTFVYGPSTSPTYIDINFYQKHGHVSVELFFKTGLIRIRANGERTNIGGDYASLFFADIRLGDSNPFDGWISGLSENFMDEAKSDIFCALNTLLKTVPYLETCFENSLGTIKGLIYKDLLVWREKDKNKRTSRRINDILEFDILTGSNPGGPNYSDISE